MNEYKKAVKDLREWTLRKRGRKTLIAKELGITYPTVCKWISGRTSFSLKNWVRLKDLMHREDQCETLMRNLKARSEEELDTMEVTYIP